MIAYAERASKDAEALIGKTIKSALQHARVDAEEDVAIVVPANLGVLPINLSGIFGSAPSLGEDYQLHFADSLRSFWNSQRRVQEYSAHEASIAIITGEVPVPDLRYLPFEVACVADFFAHKRKVAVSSCDDPQRVLESLDGTDYWHITSHAAWDFVDPSQSGVALTHNLTLTVDDVLRLKLEHPPRLVFLSACETALFDLRGSLNHFVGLSTAFLAAGAACVIGSLWPVSDAATALLSVKFYEEHISRKRVPADALLRAQQWLRETTALGFQSYVSEKAALDQSAVQAAAALSGFLANLVADYRPFQHAYFWGGFQLYGT